MTIIKAQQYHDDGSVRVASCGHCVDIHTSTYTGGYAQDRDGNTLCYACAGTADRLALEHRQPVTLYFTDNFDAKPTEAKRRSGTTWSTGRVSNWAGSWSTFAAVTYTLLRNGNVSALIRFEVQTERGKRIAYHMYNRNVSTATVTLRPQR